MALLVFSLDDTSSLSIWEEVPFLAAAVFLMVRCCVIAWTQSRMSLPLRELVGAYHPIPILLSVSSSLLSLAIIIFERVSLTPFPYLIKFTIEKPFRSPIRLCSYQRP